MTVFWWVVIILIAYTIFSYLFNILFMIFIFKGENNITDGAIVGSGCAIVMSPLTFPFLLLITLIAVIGVFVTGGK